MKAYRRKAVSVTVGRGDGYHLERGQSGHAMCSSRIVLDRASALPVERVPGVLSCMRPGCRQGWDAADKVQTFIAGTAK